MWMNRQSGWPQFSISISGVVNITFCETFFGHKELAIKQRWRIKLITTQVNSSEFEEKYDWVKKIDRGALQMYYIVCRLFNNIERKFFIKEKKIIAVFIITYNFTQSLWLLLHY